MSKVVKMKVWVDPQDPETDDVYGIYAQISDLEWEHARSRGMLIHEFVQHRIGKELESLLRFRWGGDDERPV